SVPAVRRETRQFFDEIHHSPSYRLRFLDRAGLAFEFRGSDGCFLRAGGLGALPPSLSAGTTATPVCGLPVAIAAPARSGLSGGSALGCGCASDIRGGPASIAVTSTDTGRARLMSSTGAAPASTTNAPCTAGLSSGGAFSLSRGASRFLFELGI